MDILTTKLTKVAAAFDLPLEVIKNLLHHQFRFLGEQINNTDLDNLEAEDYIKLTALGTFKTIALTKTGKKT